ncbi:MAG TPA: thermonuclease family protein [Gaiellaceae bacterium]|nr:thermonuclease family protein [Gaiellaceae bacterium]
MRGWLPGVLIALGAAAFLVWGSLAEPASPPRLEQRRSTMLASGLVASVTDGDTIRLADNRRLRLVQIDAPERPEGECYAERATQELDRLAPVGVQLSLRLDPSLDAKDEHGRWLVYAFNGKSNLNLQLVQLGAAAPYFHEGRRGRYANRLLTAAQRARATRRGLWAACPGTTLDPDRPVDSDT